MEEKKSHGPNSPNGSDTGQSEDPLNETSGRLDAILAGLANSARTTAEREEYFWERQRTAIRRRIVKLGPRPAGRRPALAWAAATMMALVAIALLVEKQAPATPDLAGGSDPQLLQDVERVFKTDLPSSLEPAGLLPDEMLPRGRIVAQP